MRALQPKPEGWVEPSRRPRGNGGNDRGDRGERGERGERRGGNDRRPGGNDRRERGERGERGDRGERHGERRGFGHRNNNAPKERPEPANDTTEEYF